MCLHVESKREHKYCTCTVMTCTIFYYITVCKNKLQVHVKLQISDNNNHYLLITKLLLPYMYMYVWIGYFRPHKLNASFPLITDIPKTHTLLPFPPQCHCYYEFTITVH